MRIEMKISGFGEISKITHAFILFLSSSSSQAVIGGGEIHV